MKKSITIILAALMATTITLSGCASKSTTITPGASSTAKNETIKFWGAANDADPNNMTAKWYKDNIDGFQKKNPNIKVEMTLIADGGQYLNKISTEMAANNAPDMFETWLSGRLEPFVKANRVMALDDIIKNDPEAKDTVNLLNCDTATFNNKIYAVPLSLTSEVVFYNKDIFKANNINIPTTFDELITDSKTLRSKNIIPMAMGNKDPFCGSIPYMLIFDRLFGPDKYKETMFDHTGKFTDPDYVAASKKLMEMKNAGAFSDNFNSLADTDAMAQFTSGKAAMYFTGTWQLASLEKQLADKVDFFNFPDIAGGKGSAADDWVASKDGGMAISANTKHKEAAAKLFGYFFSKERQAAWAEYGSLITTKNITYDKSKVNPLTVKMNDSLAKVKHSIIPWDNPLGLNIGKEFNLTTQAVLGGGNATELFSKLQKVADSEWQK